MVDGFDKLTAEERIALVAMEEKYLSQNPQKRQALRGIKTVNELLSDERGKEFFRDSMIFNAACQNQMPVGEFVFFLLKEFESLEKTHVELAKRKGLGISIKVSDLGPIFSPENRSGVEAIIEEMSGKTNIPLTCEELQGDFQERMSGKNGN